MRQKNIFLKFIWVFLAFLAVLLRVFFKNHPEWVESYYSRGVFVVIRRIFDSVSFISPIPLMYLFIGIVLFLFIKKSYAIFKMKEKIPSKLLSFGAILINGVAALVFFFLVLWGYNYQRIPIENQLKIYPKPLSLEEIKEELDSLTPTLIQQRNLLDGDASTLFFQKFSKKEFENNVNSEVQNLLQKIGYPKYSAANARFLHPKGTLLLNSTAGIYFPFVGEANIDAGLHPLTQPYILAHEFGHAYGFGDEGTCNFVAYLACRQSQNPFIRYSGILGYWRTIARNFLSYKPKEYAEFRAKLPPQIIADLDAINETHAQYPDLFPKFRTYTYDAFLKAQGIDEGIENYNRVLMLGRAWRLKNR